MKNLEKYRSVLQSDGEALLLTSRYSRMYAAEFDIAEGYAVVSKQGARYFTDSRYIESATNNIKDFEVVEIGTIGDVGLGGRVERGHLPILADRAGLPVGCPCR